MMDARFFHRAESTNADTKESDELHVLEPHRSHDFLDDEEGMTWPAQLTRSYDCLHWVFCLDAGDIHEHRGDHS